ncbi:MAG: hypothetical protein KGL37_01175 [Acidobacteriota bacterium]|nr:hypothetical protein [Acidobacteriota bacterium]
MRTIILPRFRAAQSEVRPKALPFRLRIPMALLAAAAILSGTQGLHAARVASQAPPAAQTTTPAQKPAAAGKRARASHPSHPPAQPEATPPAPKPPDWPVNDQPGQPSVVWDSHGLRVEARNSSLQQILKDVAAATGIKVAGLGTDERVFGVYGPGKARDVLSQLLEGTGYNVIMIGDQGEGTPREIVLSAQPKGPPPPAATNSQSAVNDENSVIEEQQQEQPPPAPPLFRPGFGPGAPVRTPQQIMQEMQQRQQQMQQRNNPQQ